MGKGDKRKSEAVSAEKGKQKQRKEEMSEEEKMKLMEELDAVQEKLDAVDEKASKEILQIEKKYMKEKRPMLEERKKLIAKIPDFWVTVFSHHPDLAVILSEEVDQKILSHMTNIDIQYSDEQEAGYTVYLHFSSNPYFKNAVLTKEFKFGDDGDISADPSPVQWKDDKFVEQNPDSFFVAWMNKEVPMLEIAELLTESVFKNPFALYMAPMDDSDDEEDDDEDDE